MQITSSEDRSTLLAVGVRQPRIDASRALAVPGQALEEPAPMPIIHSIDVCAAVVPLDKVTSFSNRTVSARHYGLVKVRSQEGAEGLGFCYVGSAGGELFRVAVEQLLAPVLLGQDSYAVEALWKATYQECLLPLRRVLLGRPGAQLPTPDRSATGAPRRSCAAAPGPGSGFQLRRAGGVAAWTLADPALTDRASMPCPPRCRRPPAPRPMPPAPACGGCSRPC